jgi:hypothetical protein
MNEQNLKSWKPGQSGNPAGRAKGSRNKFGEDFIAALHDDFTKHGVGVIEKVRIDRPDQYLRVIAAVIPKELQVTNASLADMSDEDVIELVATLRSFIAAAGIEGPGKE